MNLEEEEAVIKSKMLTRQVESAQKRVEGNNYDTRKQVLQYDDVMREQREIIYEERRDVITADRDLAPEIKAMIKRTINRAVDAHSRADREEGIRAILNFAKVNLVAEDSISLSDLEGLDFEAIKENLYERALKVYDTQIAKLQNQEAVIEFQKVLILMVVDNKWTDHIDALDQLRQSVGLRGYAQNNPVVEYQAEGFRMFQSMIGAIEFDVTRTMMKAQIHQKNVNIHHNVQQQWQKRILRRKLFVLKLIAILIFLKLNAMTCVLAVLVKNSKIATVVNNFKKSIENSEKSIENPPENGIIEKI